MGDGRISIAFTPPSVVQTTFKLEGLRGALFCLFGHHLFSS